MPNDDLSTFITITITKTGDKDTIPDHPIFTGYSIKALIAPGHLPEVGKSYSVMRVQRNNVDALGVFTTSAIQEVGGRGGEGDPIHFSTQNSHYTLTFDSLTPSP